MSNNAENPVTHLNPTECWERLRSHDVGRLVTWVGDVIDIFPVTYVVDGGSIVFRTAEGSKLSEITVSKSVLFEVDRYSESEGWSVVIRGTAERLTSDSEVAAADELPLQPHVPTLKLNYVRITPNGDDAGLSGRHFLRGPEPERYGVSMY